MEDRAVPGTLSGTKVAFMMANEGVEQVELTRPWDAVTHAGGTPELIAPEHGAVQAFNHLDHGGTFQAERTTAEIDPDDYDGLMLPGGVANPDRLRQDEKAVSFVKAMIDKAKPVAVICHAPWTLVEADAVRGRTLTSWPSLATDIRNAGGRWVDLEVVVCRNGPNVLVTSRGPADLDAFCASMIEVLAAGAHRAA
ncbi:MAG: type 1 glutamine amidotransferase [Acidimicrobiales bacterium]|nr:type 1 glutamine amidotransferase [Acidimicrobiales bacterium]